MTTAQARARIAAHIERAQAAIKQEADEPYAWKRTGLAEFAVNSLPAAILAWEAVTQRVCEWPRAANCDLIPACQSCATLIAVAEALGEA